MANSTSAKEGAAPRRLDDLAEPVLRILHRPTALGHALRPC